MRLYTIHIKGSQRYLINTWAVNLFQSMQMVGLGKHTLSTTVPAEDINDLLTKSFPNADLETILPGINRIRDPREKVSQRYTLDLLKEINQRKALSNSELETINNIIDTNFHRRADDPDPTDCDKIICVHPEHGEVSREGYLEIVKSGMQICQEPGPPFILIKGERTWSSASGSYWTPISPEKFKENAVYVGKETRLVRTMFPINQTIDFRLWVNVWRLTHSNFEGTEKRSIRTFTVDPERLRRFMDTHHLKTIEYGAYTIQHIAPSQWSVEAMGQSFNNKSIQNIIRKIEEASPAFYEYLLECFPKKITIDLNRLELYIERSNLQTIEWQTQTGTYQINNLFAAPKTWRTSFDPTGKPGEPYLERRGLKNILDLIETEYPEFYAYLEKTFPKDTQA